MCLQSLEAFAQSYGPNRSVIIARSTGRVNLLGTHVDHRGGSVNPIAIKQMWLIAEPRDDDLILVRNVESGRFADELGAHAEDMDDTDDWKIDDSGGAA